MLKLGSTLPNFARKLSCEVNYCKIISLHKPGQGFLEKVVENMVSGPSIAVIGIAVVDETLNRESANWCKIDARIDASQLYSHSMCQATPAGLYTRRELDSECGNLKQRQKEKRSFKSIVISDFQ